MNGLENVVALETALSEIDGENGRLHIRGMPIEAIAASRPFEEAVYFLWTGKFPNADEKERFINEIFAGMRLADAYRRYLDAIPADGDATAFLMAALAGLDRGAFPWPPDWQQGARLIGLVPAVIGHLQSRRQQRPPLQPDPELGLAGNYLYFIKGSRPAAEEIQALNGYFTLTMEHGLNASTFAARVITSTQSDLASVVVGAMAALRGPLHGGAPSGVIAMLEAIGSEENIEPWLTEQLRKGKRIMGFGHRVYRTLDPRAKVLKTLAEPLAQGGGWFALALKVEETALRLLRAHKPERSLKTNVEFYAAALFKALGLPPDFYTATFATSRLAGWCAHAIEQAQNNRIIRPLSRYVGPVHE